MSVRKSDEQLVKEFRKGSLESFEELIKRYETKAFSLAMRLTKSQLDAEEVLQDVFVTVYRKLKNFEGKSTFSSWLYRITVNTSFMKLRKRRSDRTTPIEDLSPTTTHKALAKAASAPTSDGIAARHELCSALDDAIKRLPEEYRPVFVLRDVDGLSSIEVSKILRISIPAVKSRLHRSRALLRKRLTKIYREFQECDVGFAVNE